jgi:hypothetical protein
MQATEKTRGLSILAAVLLACAAFTGCSGGSGTATVSNGYGHLEIHLTDAPLDMSNVAHVWVTITDVIVYPGIEGMDEEEPAPVPLMTTPREFDLLTLMNGLTDLLAEDMIPAGFYQRVRLVVSEARVVFTDDSEEPLKIESRKVDVVIPFELKEGDDMALLLDFDAEASVKVTPTGSDKYILRPVVNGSAM